jgi:K+-sensing histidine kinase KdpD
VGKRIGQSASLDVETAARRMAVVGAQDIRSVTMSMVRPRSVPEIREMALALDALAATLLRMAEDQKRALSARTEAARVRSFVLASVSHDLRGPLNSVLGFAELLLSGAEGPLEPGQRESLDALCRGGRDLLRLVGDLLDHARIDAGRMTVEKARVPVDRVIERARDVAIERAKTPVDIDAIAIEGEAGLRVLADEELMGPALGSLVAFALLRPGSNGRVVIRMRGEGEKVAITIRGGGSTPSREALSRMFEPFDFAPSGARAPAGLNLAVSVARGIFALHGGTVTAVPHEEGGIALGVALTAAGLPPPTPAVALS